ncbi:uncharacterized protein N7459_002707 [Penicillium hispanicum]|uniref:uncharacterized protein n=1 Tax=Penicillium hispanicum TaxID=1080232 RepID=UPI0025413F96|nr:uncharacterized protein N7459_002707 [Penicillium hispanicum]KAJ5586942.1 hypothetical protein N7459_002707 [Penicillium hispanicum]
MGSHVTPRSSSFNFANSILSLYHGPQVKIRIASAEREFIVSRELLCTQSTYFAKLFEGGFSEAQTQSATLEEIPGVVSVRSLGMLLQWLYTGQFHFDAELVSEEDEISAMIEFVRLADMCNVSGMETTVANKIKENIADWSTSYLRFDGELYGEPEMNTKNLTDQHIISALHLPKKHPVRRLLAEASVEGYLRFDSWKFEDLAEDHPDYAADLLRHVKQTLNSIFRGNKEKNRDDRRVYFRDPVTKVDTWLMEDLL